MSQSDKVIAFIERYCMTPDGIHVGKPIQLADFQRKFIADIYDNPAGTRRAYLSIARKNGKSALIACLLLTHLVGPVAIENTQIVSGARSRDQAALVFDLARKMVQMDDTLRDLVRIVPSGKRLIGISMNTEYKALSAEAKTAYGLSPVLAILDEVGQVVGPRDEFIDAIVTSQGAHAHPLLIAISTQAPTDADLFSAWLDDAQKSDDKRIVSRVYEAEKDADVMDEAAWQASNPALDLFRSRDDLEEQADRASRMPAEENRFRNLCLNQRISVLSPFIARSVWESCGAEPAPMEGVSIYGGLDLSARTDLTAFVAIWQDGDAIWQVMPFFWTPKKGLRDRSKRDRVPYDVWVEQGYIRTTPGATVDYEFVAHDLADILSDVDVSGIAFDRWRIDVMQKELDRIGLELPLVPYGQGYKDQSPALDVVESELLNGRVAHGMHPVLTMCAANAVVTRDPANNRKLDKAKATGRIDGMAGLANAFGIAVKQEEEGESIYQERGLITL